MMKLSILTPTYNRAYILPQLYESLMRQENYNFEWIVVDDGSEDETEKLVKNWMKQTDVFSIFYMKQENGGKHRALNAGMKAVHGEYVYIIDSDDYLVDGATTLIEKWIEEIDWKIEFAGVAGVKIDKTGTMIGQYPAGVDFVDATNIERRNKHLEGDKAEIYRANVLRKYPFPEFAGEKFLSECAVWDKIGMDGLKIRWFKNPICICEYRLDGLTMQGEKELKNFQGYTYVIKQQISYEAWNRRLALIAQYRNVASKKTLEKGEICSELKISGWEFWLAPIAKWIHDRRKKKWQG